MKSEAQQKKLKTVRGSYTDLDLSKHAKKGPEKSCDTLPLSGLFVNLELSLFCKQVFSSTFWAVDMCS
jgi:hypothetical protein